VGWDREDGLKETEDRLIVDFDKNATNPLAANVSGITPKGVLRFAGANGIARNVGDPNLNRWAPINSTAAQEIEHFNLQDPR
jgi:hypothetical protein